MQNHNNTTWLGSRATCQDGVEFNVPLYILKVISETNFPADLLPGSKHIKLNIITTNNNTKEPRKPVELNKV